MVTMPSSRLALAPVGHTSTHSGFAQCWHCCTMKYISMSGYWAPSYLGLGPTRLILLKNLPGPSWLACLQAVLQARQPTQRSRSMAMAYWDMA